MASSRERLHGHASHQHQPQVLVKPLRWGPPGEDIDALRRDMQRASSRQLASSSRQPDGSLREDLIGQVEGHNDKSEDATSISRVDHGSPPPTSSLQQQGGSSSSVPGGPPYERSSSRQPTSSSDHVPGGPPYDVIVGSDLIYYTYSEATPHSKLLLWTLRRVAVPGSLIYLALSLHHNPEEVRKVSSRLWTVILLHFSWMSLTGVLACVNWGWTQRACFSLHSMITARAFFISMVMNSKTVSHSEATERCGIRS